MFPFDKMLNPHLNSIFFLLIFSSFFLNPFPHFPPQVRGFPQEVGVREGRDERDRRAGHPPVLRLPLHHGRGRGVPAQTKGGFSMTKVGYGLAQSS